MECHQGVAQGLVDHGVSTVFGLIGDGNLYVADAFRRLPGTAFISLSQESAAVQAAIGYTQVSGRLGVATVTHGPGLTNCVTALIEATKARLPLLLIAGDTATKIGESTQNIAQREVVLATGAGFEQVRTPDTVADDLASAIARAYRELRPVVLNLPVDFQWVEIEYQPARTRFTYRNAGPPDPESMDAAVGIIAGARRPIVLAGRGAISPGARAALVRLAARIGAPLATTLKARDLFRGHAHDLGICGTLTHQVALDTLSSADCIIAFGASLNPWTTAEGALVTDKRLIHVDSDPRSIGVYVTPDVAVVGDAAIVADTIVEWLDEAESRPTAYASPELAAALASPSLHSYIDRSSDQTIDLRTALLHIDRQFPVDRTVVTDAGRYLRTTFKLLHVQEPSGFVHTTHYGSVGLSMGVAIGASIGVPDRPVLAVCGDGGLMLGCLSEFITAVRHGLDLVVVVFNDGAFGAEYVHFERRGMDPSISRFDWPDFAPIATAMGGRGFTVRTTRELDEALATLVERDRPVLIDIKIDPAASLEN